ncbi:MAG: ATP-binding protein [Hyphomicrobiales bacterium]|nr:ATP-binding protein [Hyphomicrobiales bacterium]
MLKRPVDLTSCDTEPIHRIGAIQPIGVLIAVDEHTMTIEFASSNTSGMLGRSCSDLLGRPLADLLGDEPCRTLLARRLQPTMPDLLRPWFLSIQHPDRGTVDLECYPHRHDGWIILEFVDLQGGLAVMWEEDLIRQRIISELIRPSTLTELAKVGAQIIREVTGFDRVMIYRFAEDKHGEVIAESTVRDDSFLGLHYPASDIPDPARRHFLLNVIRLIPDINATPVPIMTQSGAIADDGFSNPLDLTFSKLRAVAPVHVEYLNNMGVGASMSISLTANNQLWGLVACHHYQPLHLSWSKLRFCELVGGTISALLQSLENTIKLRHSIRAEKTAFAVEREARMGKPLADVIRDHAADLMEQCSANGIAVMLNNRLFQVGVTAASKENCQMLRERLIEGIATDDQLSGPDGTAAGAASDISGAAMMELSDDGQDWLILFRESYEQTIRWAGKPDKIARHLKDGSVRLSPRGSFALWSEERRGRSKPFGETDHEILRITRRALFAMNSLDRERGAVAAQMEAEAEEARLRLVLLDAARDRSLGELASALAHELNQPLSAVTNYVNACRQELRNFGLKIPEHVDKLMESAVTESSRAADLVRRLRNFIGQGEISLERADLHAVIRQGVDLALMATSDEQCQLVFEFDGNMPPILADPVQVGQVILNLVRNGLTAMQDSDERILTIATRRPVEGRVEVSIRDTGVGIPKDLEQSLFEPFHNSTTRGMGIGLSLCRSIVEAHGGKIWTRRIDDQTEFVFTLKINESGDA